MNLTSVRRIRLALGITTTEQDPILSRLVGASSARIEDWLRRPGGLELKSRTEYISPSSDQNSFSLLAYPIASIVSVKIDSSGLFVGNETTLAATSYTISNDLKNLIIYPGQAVWPSVNGFAGSYRYVSQKTIQVVYTGGIAADAVVSSWTTSASAFTAGNYVVGSMSGCVGYITTTASGSITFELLAGAPLAGEMITEFKEFNFGLSGGGGLNPTSQTATLTTVTTPSLVEIAPDLVEGSEMHIMYLRRNRDRFEESASQQGVITKTSAGDRQKDFFSLTETRDMLMRHQDKRIGILGKR